MAKVELKQPIVEEISELVKDAAAVVLVSSRGLTVEQDTQMRKEFREAGVKFKVYKNTMMHRAFEGTDFSKLDEYLEGPSAIAVSYDDVTAPARIISKYAKTIEPLTFKAGVIEGDFYDTEKLQELADIPSRDVLISRLLGSLQSPVTNLLRVINQIAEKGGAGNCESAAKEEVAEEVKEEVKEEVAAEATETVAEVVEEAADKTEE